VKSRNYVLLLGMLIGFFPSANVTADMFGSNDCPPWEYDCNDWPEWTPMYWMEEMSDGFGDDDDYYRYGGMGGPMGGYGMPYGGGYGGGMPYGGGYGAPYGYGAPPAPYGYGAPPAPYGYGAPAPAPQQGQHPHPHPNQAPATR
jgi:hypothetical protein